MQVDVEKMLRALKSDEPFAEFARELSKEYNPGRRPHLLARARLDGGRVCSLLHVAGEQRVFAGLENGELATVKSGTS